MTDSEFIDLHGGTAKFARMTGARINAVTNWRTRGIPAHIKVANPELFFGALARKPEHPQTEAAKDGVDADLTTPAPAPGTPSPGARTHATTP